MSTVVCMFKTFYMKSGENRGSKVRSSILVVFGSHVSLRVHYCKRVGVYFTTLLWQNSVGKMAFRECCFWIVQKHGEIKLFSSVVGRAIAPIAPSWIPPAWNQTCCVILIVLCKENEHMVQKRNTPKAKARTFSDVTTNHWELWNYALAIDSLEWETIWRSRVVAIAQAWTLYYSDKTANVVTVLSEYWVNQMNDKVFLKQSTTPLVLLQN